MRLLVIDRDNAVHQQIRARLEPLGHEIVSETVKNSAMELLETEVFDVVLVDPAPLETARPIVLGIRRSVRNYPYIVILSDTVTPEDALRTGANGVLTKPLALDQLEQIIENGARLTALVQRIGDESEDFPSAGGVIAKSAFNQLFLSAIDRADRYAENSFLLFIGIRNYKDLMQTEGPYVADFAVARLSQYLVRQRRQSDIIAQTGKNEFCLMLQRPVYETEPMDAANRFAEVLKELDDLCQHETTRIDIYVRLIELPLGGQGFERILHYEKGQPVVQVAR